MSTKADTMNDASVTPISIGGRIIGILVWGIVAGLFGFLAWNNGIEPIATTVGNWQMAKSYQPVAAEIVQREAKDNEGNNATWLAAKYSVDGKTFFAERMTVLDDDGYDDPANNVALKSLEESFKHKQSPTIFVSPRRPEIALISRDLPLQSTLVRLPLAIGFAALALVGVLGVAGAMFNLGYYQRLKAASVSWAIASVLAAIFFPVFIVIGTDTFAAEFIMWLVGVFALLTLWWIKTEFVAIFSDEPVKPSPLRPVSHRSKLPDSALRTTGGHTKKIDNKVKRGGLGGQGDGVDKK